MVGDATSSHLPASGFRAQRRSWIALVLLLAGVAWSAYAWRSQRPQVPLSPPEPLERLEPGAVAAMDSPALQFGDGWTISSEGASPSEPSDPWAEPAGDITFSYTGSELALNLSVGDYWGYLYVTVDGRPASLLPYIRGNYDSTGSPAGYRTFYEPDQAQDNTTVSQWVRIHRDGRTQAAHDVRIEIWRSWGKNPLRGVAVDAMPTPGAPLWPGVALMLLALATAVPTLRAVPSRSKMQSSVGSLRSRLGWLLLPDVPFHMRLYLATISLAVAAAGIALSSWVATVSGLAALFVLSLARPSLWTAALLFSLPFYFSFATPILPDQFIGLIDSLVLLGIFVALGNRVMEPQQDSAAQDRIGTRLIQVLLAVLIGWALVTAVAADQLSFALREWRTVFLSAGMFAFLLTTSLRQPATGRTDLWLLAAAWLAGGVTVAAIGLVQYVTGSMLISAEGVFRIRALYGSPNNLALYLERTLIVTLALAAFLPNGKWRFICALGAILQAAALFLTFSKGSLFLGVPAGLVVLWIGGFFLLPEQGRSRRSLLWLGGAAVVLVLAILPFLGTDRFRHLLDFSQGTGYLRLQLWKSAWHMALDHPLLGVGPDNFLYAYRSAYILPQAWQEPDLNHPHNWILDWWTRTGLPGLSLAIALFALGFRELWQVSRTVGRAQLPAAVLSLGLLAAGIAALAHGLIDASYALPDLMIVWVFILMAAEALPNDDRASAMEKY